jgi:hypothetical protein
MLGFSRAAFGAAAFIAPIFTAKLFQIPATPDVAILVRFFGIRDLIIGELLLTTDYTGGTEPKETRRAILAGLASDFGDIIAASLALASGASSLSAYGMTAGSLSIFALIGLSCLKKL